MDTCLPNRTPAIWHELAGAPVSDILITHYDVDHIGSLAWLAEKSGAAAQ
ncbi:MBL fold metallo-hydrolase [Sulfobacillus sp. DSM 109850]|uniref:MBL fold metallo-hydrolase n=1 Tax=Sulfobacillus harzensis TaxID=2729629 RepID=A0A7Y0L5T8_9FIRM|nr:MBL fold metallo-hydrolase [Sulfobacillus harzensis]